MKEKILSVNDLTVKFNESKESLTAVDHINFDVYKGETFGLVGESGSGKTTTGRAIMGIQDLTNGSVYFENHLVRGKIPSLKLMTKRINHYLKTINQYKNSFMKLINAFLKDFKKASLNSPKLINEIQDSMNENLSYLIEVIRNLDTDKQTINLLMTDIELDSQVLKPYYDLLNKIYDFIILVKKTLNDVYKLFSEIKDNPQEEQLKELVHDIKLINRITNSLVGDGKKLKQLRNTDKEIKNSRLFKKLNKKENHLLKEKMQMIFQDPGSSLNSRMNVEQIIGEGLDNFPELYKNNEAINAYLKYESKNGQLLTREQVKYSDVKRFLIEQMLKAVGMLPEHLNRYPHEFSGGQQQRIGIARSLIMKPEFIIADEPISSLDVSIRAQIINLLIKFQKEYGLTYIFIAHDLTVVRFIADRIGVIYHGKLVELADSEELFKHPLHPYTKALLNAIPIPNPDKESNKAIQRYDENKEHYDYLVDYPTWREVKPGHYVYLNDREVKKIK